MLVNAKLRNILFNVSDQHPMSIIDTFTMVRQASSSLETLPEFLIVIRSLYLVKSRSSIFLATLDLTIVFEAPMCKKKTCDSPLTLRSWTQIDDRFFASAFLSVSQPLDP